MKRQGGQGAGSRGEITNTQHQLPITHYPLPMPNAQCPMPHPLESITYSSLEANGIGITISVSVNAPFSIAIDDDVVSNL